MAISNGYCTLAEFKEFTHVGDQDDTALEKTIETASRAIDQFTARRFYQENSTAKTYTAEWDDLLYIDDLYNTTGLTVKTDTTGDGTYDTTWTITTDFLVGPANPQPGWPYTQIRTNPRTGSYTYPLSPHAVEVTGNYGWTAVPEQIRHACLMETNRLWHRRNSPEGVAGFNEYGVARITSTLDPGVENLLKPFRKLPAVVGLA